MLKFDASQMKAFSIASEQRFFDRMATHVKQTFPEDCAGCSDVEINAKLRELANVAKSYSVTKKSDLSRFFTMAYLFGEGFHQELPWAKNILGEPSTSGSAKMALLQQEACCSDEG